MEVAGQLYLRSGKGRQYLCRFNHILMRAGPYIYSGLDITPLEI